MMKYDVKQLKQMIYKAYKNIPPENPINIGATWSFGLYKYKYKTMWNIKVQKEKLLDYRL